MKREVVARIDVGALRHNLAVVRRRCPHSRVIAMVKANGYGHGLVQSARAFADADALGVAVIDEAMALREHGIGKPLVLIEGVWSANELRVASEQGFALVIHQREQLEMLMHTPLPRPVDVWLKLETGMHRLGLPPEIAAAAASGLRGRTRFLGVMTHFACADEASNPMNRRQLDALAGFARNWQLPASAANSAAILSLPAAHLDVVRPGIMLYGGAAVAGRSAAEFDLRPAMTLSARLIAINEVPRGEGVGYGATWHAPRDARIGIVGIGYGDGYPRHVMPGTPVLVGTQRVSIVGRVSMDMLAIDLSARPEVKIGDEVVLWGEGMPADTVAHHAGTISYELFCRLTPRVRFDYSA